MARLRTVTAGALNIRTHPKHSAEQYQELIKSAYNLKRSIKVRGDQHMLLSYIDATPREDGSISGTIARFTNIDSDLPWFNSESLEEASDDEIRSIVIPRNLKPNYVPFNFIMYPKNHLLVFEVYSLGKAISPNVVLRFAEILFADKVLLNRHEEITVDLVYDHEKVDQLLDMKTLKKLEITIKKPNPDDLGGLDERIQERLLKENARSVTETIEATEGKGIKPTEDTRNLAKLASQNGSVEAKGYNEAGIRVEESTKNHPKLQIEKFDPDLTPDITAFQKVAKILSVKVAAVLK